MSRRVPNVGLGLTALQSSVVSEAVELWCGGCRQTNGDGDGIYCETMCSSKVEGDENQAQIGC